MNRTEICQTLVALQRHRRVTLKLRISDENRIISQVAVLWGYRTDADKEERKQVRGKAEKLMRAIDAGKEIPNDPTMRVAADIIRIGSEARLGYREYEKGILAEMVEHAKQLPVAPWFDHPDRRGVGLTILGTIVGECGDLANYATVSKLWKRMFGAPYTHKGETRMPSQWKRMKGAGLSAEDFVKMGNSGRRNAAFYQLRQNIVMQNRGPYRAKYDSEKAKKLEQGRRPIHAHNHGMLMAAKQLVKELWCEWNGREVIRGELECDTEWVAAPVPARSARELVSAGSERI